MPTQVALSPKRSLKFPILINTENYFVNIKLAEKNTSWYLLFERKTFLNMHEVFYRDFLVLIRE